jgi:brefeldin A-inhibited guanine nucleotide-exchange protein
MEAIRLIRVVADHIAANQKAFETLSGDDISNIPLADRVWLRGWFPLMFELSAVIRYEQLKLFIFTKLLQLKF